MLADNSYKEVIHLKKDNNFKATEISRINKSGRDTFEFAKFDQVEKKGQSINLDPISLDQNLKGETDNLEAFFED